MASIIDNRNKTLRIEVLLNIRLTFFRKIAILKVHAAGEVAAPCT